MQPSVRPANPCFSSGPCAKRPGWSVAALGAAMVGRSHRAKPAKARIAEVLDRSRQVLAIPDDYRIAIVPASDTGAFEMALWTMIGARPVAVLAWESFSHGWATDVRRHLGVADCTLHEADYGALPELSAIDMARDLVFVWNGTTSGVRLPDGDWIADDRAGLTFCDATSAAFAMALPWSKLDVVTYSWQKVLGGEGQHGILILSPRAVARLESFTPERPLPKIFRLTKGGKLIEGIFRGETINTPSMLCVEDALDGLRWVESIGGHEVLVGRCRANLAAIEAWVSRTPWVDFLAERAETRSPTSVCLKIVAPAFTELAEDAQRALTKTMCDLLEAEGAAFDINGYRDAPPGLRLWAGATIEKADLDALFPWLDWAYNQSIVA